MVDLPIPDSGTHTRIDGGIYLLKKLLPLACLLCLRDIFGSSLLTLLFNLAILFLAFKLKVFNLVFHKFWEIELIPICFNFAARTSDVLVSLRLVHQGDMVAIIEILWDLLDSKILVLSSKPIILL